MRIGKPTAMFFLTRLIIFIVMLLAYLLIAHNNPYHLREDAPLLVDILGSRWDTGFYVGIAENGYWTEGHDFPATPFFPLFPLLMRVGMAFGGDALLVGILIANTALWLTTILFYRWVAEQNGEEIASRTIWYFLIFPTAFFGSAIYTESLFALCALATFFFYRRERWFLAALCAGGAALSRSVGIILLPVLVIEWWVRRQKLAGQKSFALMPPAAAPIGLASYMLFLDLRFDDPMAFANAQQAWGRAVQTPLTAFKALFQPSALGGGYGSYLNNWIDFAFVALFLVLGVALLHQRRWAEGVFVLCGVLMPISTGQLVSVRRYVWVLFPAFVVLAQWGQREWADRTVTTVSLMGLALFAGMFALGYYVA